MCFCQNLHSQFMTEAGERLCVLNLIAPLATFFPAIGFLCVKNKSSRISNDFIYKPISGNATQKSMHAPDEGKWSKSNGFWNKVDIHTVTEQNSTLNVKITLVQSGDYPFFLWCLLIWFHLILLVLKLRAKE